jgi:hypothetical protein
MTAAVSAVSGKEIESSFDCQLIFDAVGFVAKGIAKIGIWSVTNAFSESQKTKIAHEFQKFLNCMPESVFTPFQGAKRDINLLFNKPDEKDFSFNVQEDNGEVGSNTETKKPVYSKQAVDQALETCKQECLEARRCAQRIALVAAWLGLSVICCFFYK